MADPDHCHSSHMGFLVSRIDLTHRQCDLLRRHSGHAKKQMLTLPCLIFFTYRITSRQLLPAHKFPLHLALPACPAMSPAFLHAFHMALHRAMPFHGDIRCSLCQKCPDPPPSPANSDSWRKVQLWVAPQVGGPVLLLPWHTAHRNPHITRARLCFCLGIL